MWMLRSQAGQLLPRFLEDGIVALGWAEIGDLKNKTRESIKKSLYNNFPQKDYKAIPTWTGILENFVHNVEKGDLIITYDPSMRIYYVAEVIGNYKYMKSYSDIPNVRKVKWFDQEISRDMLSLKAKHSLGATMSLFRVPKGIETEIKEILAGKKVPPKTESEKEQETDLQTREAFENSTELLKDKIMELSPDEMQELMKEILNAMGYVAKCSSRGYDLGKDVFASKDGLGLEEPRIFVEVKHRDGRMSAPEVRKFLGGRKVGDKCLYLSTGGFTKDARYEADRSNIPLTLIDLSMLTELVSLYYDKFSVEGRSLLRLRKVYLPF